MAFVLAFSLTPGAALAQEQSGGVQLAASSGKDAEQSLQDGISETAADGSVDVGAMEPGDTSGSDNESACAPNASELDDDESSDDAVGDSSDELSSDAMSTGAAGDLPDNAVDAAGDTIQNPSNISTGAAAAKLNSDSAADAQSAVVADGDDADDEAADRASADEKTAADDAKAATRSASAATRSASTSDEKISVTFKLVGAGADGSDELWIGGARSVDEGTTADALIEDALSEAGLTHTSTYDKYGYYLSDITAADGRVLGYDAVTGKYWQLFVNGKASEVGASSVTLAEGDVVTLYYSAYGTKADAANVAKVKVSISVIGPNAAGDNCVWAQLSDTKVKSGTTADTLTEKLLTKSGLKHTSTTSEYGYYLSDITSIDGRTLGWDSVTGKYWQLFVNGVASEVGASSVVIEPGDRIQWIYSAYGDDPSSSPVLNPNSELPDWDAGWSGFNNGGDSALVNVATPTDSATALWTLNLATDDDKWVSLGDPIIAGGYIFLTTNTQLIKIDMRGNVVARVSKWGSTSYFSRPVYADGLIISANDDGSIYAFNADTLEVVWKTAALDASDSKYQCNSTMTVSNGCVYAEFVSGVSWSGPASGGAMVCVEIATGQVKWINTSQKEGDSTGEGYYWAGAAASGSDLVIGDESGCVKLIDGATGKVKSQVSLNGNVVRATIVSAGEEDGNPVYLAVGRQPATLYKVVREGDALRLVSSCEFGNTSTSTPAVSGGKVYVGGNDSSYNGLFAVIDLATMEVETSYSTGKYAEVKASPLVSVQGDGTYVYFTCNVSPGSLFRFSQSTGQVEAIYTPEGSAANYCTASVIADAQGNLYYTNDSGTLFALGAAAGCKVTFESNGGSFIPAANPAKGKPIVKVADPVRSGYTFDGWFTDSAFTEAWDFSQPVNSDMTLYAKWISNDGSDDGDGKGDGKGDGDGDTHGGGDDKHDGDDTDNDKHDSDSDDGDGDKGGHDSHSEDADKGGDSGANDRDDDGENGGSTSTGFVSGGYVAPSATPVAANAGQTSGNAAGDSDRAAETAASPLVSSAASSDTRSSLSSDGAGVDEAMAVDAPIWPYVLIGVGAAGAIAAVVWLILGRKRNEGDEE